MAVENGVMVQDPAQIHIRLDGRSFDIPLTELDVGVLSSDSDIRTAVANHVGVPRVKLEAFTIDKNRETGHMTLRPEAVFGVS